jgi:tripartite-type tricarboxylate transporter receptor subunit TctC
MPGSVLTRFAGIGLAAIWALTAQAQQYPAQDIPIQEQLSKWFNQVTSSEEAKKFLNNFASDPWVLSPADAQAALHKEMTDWGEYMKIARLQPQG